MEEDGSRIAGYFKNRSVLVTGSTGFHGKSIYDLLLHLARLLDNHLLLLSSVCRMHCVCSPVTVAFFFWPLGLVYIGAVLVEKILRVQPDVKRTYLPGRAPDAASAKERVDTEVTHCNCSLSPLFYCYLCFFFPPRKHGNGMGLIKFTLSRT
jgi:hypothetical protein